MGLCCRTHSAVLRVWAAQLTMHFQELRHASACMQALPAVRSSLAVLVLVLRLLPPCSRCRFQVHLFQLTPALQQFKLACSRRHAVTIQQVPARLLTVRLCFSINATAQHPTASGLSWKPWKSLHGSSSSQTNGNLSRWQARENNPKCERLLPKPNRTRIASACHNECHGHRARTPRAMEPDRLKLASPGAIDIGMSRQSTCNKSPFPTKLAALQGYGSYPGHDQA